LNASTCGMITGWGSHHVDIAHWGMGTEYAGPIAVDAKAAWPGTDSFWDVHDKFSVKLTYSNGVTTTISDELPNGVRFEGEQGWIWVSRGNTTSPKALNASDPNPGGAQAQAGGDKRGDGPSLLRRLSRFLDRDEARPPVEMGSREGAFQRRRGEPDVPSFRARTLRRVPLGEEGRVQGTSRLTSTTRNWASA